MRVATQILAENDFYKRFTKHADLILFFSPGSEKNLSIRAYCFL